MRKPSSPKIVVGPNDSMPDILTRLRSATGGPAALAIPASSSLLLTASEFRALKAAAEQARVTLTVETDDRLRRQLATMFKIPVIDLLPGAVDVLEDTPPAPPVSTPEPAQTPVPLTKPHQVMPEVPKLELPPALEVTPVWEPPADSEKSDDVIEVAPKPKRSFRKLAIVFGSLMSIVLVAALAVGALAYFFQTATVTIVAKREAVTADLTYAVVIPGAEAPAGAAFSITAEPVTMDVPYQKTIPVTGVIREPDQIATGTVALRNPGSSAVELAAGTTITDRDGTVYVVDATVSVPPADATNGAGRAEAKITAQTGGEAANREIGMLSGKLDNGLFYSNRDLAIAGGTDRKTPVVDQADIDQLIADANSEILALAVSTPLPDGRAVLPGSLQPGELTYTVNQAVGDQVDSISISAEMRVAGMAFSPTDAATQAAIQLQNDLTANTPPGLEFEPASTSIGAPVLVNDEGDAGLYRITATAKARQVVDEDEKTAVAEAIAGMSLDNARQYLNSVPFADQSTISSSPGFLPVRIPDNADKIEIEIR